MEFRKQTQRTYTRANLLQICCRLATGKLVWWIFAFSLLVGADLREILRGIVHFEHRRRDDRGPTRESGRASHNQTHRTKNARNLSFACELLGELMTGWAPEPKYWGDSNHLGPTKSTPVILLMSAIHSRCKVKSKTRKSCYYLHEHREHKPLPS